MWEGEKYECIGIRFGLAPAPRLAMKLLAPLMRYLRRLGLRASVYIDDIIILARSRVQSLKHTELAVDFIHRLGFGIHSGKLQKEPRQSVEFLGFQVNSVKIQSECLETRCETFAIKFIRPTSSQSRVNSPFAASHH